MRDVLGAILVFLACGVAMTAAATALAWWFDPARQTIRALTRALGAHPDAVGLAVQRRQGLAVRIDEARLAVIRGPADRGLIYDLDELVGVELIFDGVVAARMHLGEPRRALDQIRPQASLVVLRLTFDDVRDPEFELKLLDPSDLRLRRPPNAEAAVLEGRRWFARLEAALRRMARNAAQEPARGTGLETSNGS